MISAVFIRRPRLAMVISIVFVLCGLIALPLLPVGEFPPVTPPQVQVSASFPGANAQTVIDSVAGPIEQQVNGVEGMLYMQSTASNDGNYTLTVTFSFGTDPDLAQVNVQNRVSQATPLLPEAVTRQGVRVKKQSTDMLMVINVYSPDGSLTPEFISNYASINVSDVLARIDGVAETANLGALDYAMRIWLDPDRMAGLELTAEEVVAAISEQNVEVAAGKIGGEPVPAGQQFQYTLTTPGRLASVAEFENIVVRGGGSHGLVFLRDIARVELGAGSYASFGDLDGNPAAVLAVYKLPEANALAVADAIHARLAELEQDFPHGLEQAILYDTTRYVRISIREVISTLLEALLLVVAVVFLFLGDWRTTLIPALAIPVSLIGTLAVMLGVGMSINTVSLFGLILAIGVVVDDAIIVIENTERHVREGKSGREAALLSMREVTGPVVATTLVLLAVFVPVMLMPGISGSLYRQFAITISVAVLISSVNALTLSPALAALLIREHRAPAGFLGAFSRWLERLTGHYGRLIGGSLRRLPLTVAVYVALGGVLVWLLLSLPTAFVPDEDKGAFFVDIQLPDGASLERTEKVADQVREILLSEADVANVITVRGYSMLKGVTSANSALSIVVLKDWDQRPERAQHQRAIAMRARNRLFAIPDAMVVVFAPPALPGVGSVSGLDYRLLDQLGRAPADLAAVSMAVVAAANAAPEISQAFASFRAAIPQIEIDPDRVKAKEQGISLDRIFGALQTLLGSRYVNDFNLYGRTFRVMVQAEGEFRNDESDIGRIFVRNAANEMVPLSALVEIREKLGPETLNRYNLLASATVTAIPAPGYTESEALAVMEEISATQLPSGYTHDWSGITFQSLQAGKLAPVIFSLALVFVYLFLVALYESWLIPVAILLSVPLAILGALAGLMILGIPLNLYAQIGLVLMIAMSAKTAILVVEFAKQLHENEGLDIAEAAIRAARLRFRAVLMTALSFIFGVLPLVLASGAGAASRVSLGAAVFFGMLAFAVLGTLLIPACFMVVQKSRMHLKRQPAA